MLTYRIFLASSIELKPDRLEFEVFIARLNDQLHDQNKNVRFELKIWERVDNAVHDTRKQDQYNADLDTCDLFVLLYWTKMGRFSEEEFDRAYKRFKDTGRPKTFTYKKTIDHPATVTDANRQSLIDFDIYLHETIGHFTDTYELGIELTAKFKTEIDKLFVSGYLQYGQPAILLSPNGASDPNVFLGREDELKTIREKLDKGGKLMLINAEGGIGKTTLAAKYWNESLNEYKHNAWLFCENGIINALKELAPKLNVDLSNLDEQQQLKALKQGLSRVHDDFLLVLDNANNENEIRIFRQEFEGFHWHVLMTSRCNGVLDPSQELHISHLPPPLAKELFERNYRENTAEYEALLDRVLKSINYHTLLIDIFSKNLKKASKNGLDIKTFLEKLESQDLYLGEDSFTVQSDYTGARKKKAATTDEILEILYDFTKLDENERHALVNIALLPAESFTDSFLLDLTGEEEKALRKRYLNTFEDLFHKGWLSGEVNESYRISPVVQKLVLNKNVSSLSYDARDLLSTLNLKLANDGYNFTNIKLYEANQYARLVPTISKFLFNDPSEDLAIINFNAGLYYEITGFIIEAKRAFEKYQNIFFQLLITSPENLSFKYSLAISYSKLGGIYEVTGDWKKAITSYQEGNRIAKELYEIDPKNLSYKTSLAISFKKLGNVFKATSDTKNQLVNYRMHNKTDLEITEINTENLTYEDGFFVMRDTEGDIFSATKDLDKALIIYQERNRVAKERYDSKPNSLSYKHEWAMSYGELGDLFKAKYDWQNVLFNYQKWNNISLEIYNINPENLTYKKSLAISYERLGGFFKEKDDWKNALLNYQEWNKISIEIFNSNPENLSYKNGLAISHFYVGLAFIYIDKKVMGLNNHLITQKLIKEIIVETNEQFVQYIYNYWWISWSIVSEYKTLNPNEQTQFLKIDLIQSNISGYNTLKPFVDSGVIQDHQKIIFDVYSKLEWEEL